MTSYETAVPETRTLFLTGPLDPSEIWFSWDSDRSTGSRPSAWPAGKQLLIRDIVLLRLLELEERNDESGATRDALASYMRVARPRISTVSLELETEGLVSTVSKRPGGHGRVRKLSRLSPEGRSTAEDTRAWVLREIIEWEGVSGTVAAHIARSGRSQSVTAILRGAKFSAQEEDRNDDREGQE